MGAINFLEESVIPKIIDRKVVDLSEELSTDFHNNLALYLLTKVDVKLGSDASARTIEFMLDIAKAIYGYTPTAGKSITIHKLDDVGFYEKVNANRKPSYFPMFREEDFDVRKIARAYHETPVLDDGGS